MIACLLLHIGANVAHSGRRLLIRLAKENPMEADFCRAMRIMSLPEANLTHKASRTSSPKNRQATKLLR
jgi:hypothetical protein